jgi:hypothetical protein
LCALTNPCVNSGNSFMMISEWVATRFSLTLSMSTGAMCAHESMRQLWKQFQ